jgi:hypothetical protein
MDTFLPGCSYSGSTPDLKFRERIDANRDLSGERGGQCQKKSLKGPVGEFLCSSKYLNKRRKREKGKWQAGGTADLGRPS